jgi:hypothetical protein
LIFCYFLSCFLGRNVRLKAWKGLRPGPLGIDDKPPHEVKNILTPVILQADKDIKAWLCYPSVYVLRGEIMTPNSLYDCRMKLRTGMLLRIKSYVNSLGGHLKYRLTD